MKARIDGGAHHALARLGQDRPAQRDHDGERSHHVKQGERLSDLAGRYRVATSAIVAANPDRIREPSLPLTAGDRLTIPAEAEAGLVPYTVQPGETLDDIVARRNLDPGQVAADNGFGGGDASAVYPGDILLLPREESGIRAYAGDGEPPVDDISDLFAPQDDPDSLDAGEAQDAMLDFSRNFEILDRDGNGYVTGSELQYVVDHADEFEGDEAAAVEAATQALQPLADPADDPLSQLFPTTSTVFDQLDTGLVGETGVSSAEVARTLAAMQPPEDATTQARAAFIAAQIQAVDRAHARGRLSAEDAEAMHATIYGGVDDPEFAATLVNAVAAGGATPEQIVTVLDRVTEGMTPDQVDAVLIEVQPALQQAAAVRHLDRGDDRRDHIRNDEYQAVAAFYGALARISERAGDAGNAAMADALAPSFPDGDLEAIDDALQASVEAGEGLPLIAALSAALQAAGKQDGAEDVLSVATEEAILGEARTSVEDYAQLTEQYFYALSMRPYFLGDDEAFEAALEVLMSGELGDDWQAQIDTAQEAMADEGAALLTRLRQFRGSDDVVQTILDDPASVMAIGTALIADPSLVQGDNAQPLLELCAELGIVGADHPLAAVVVDAYIRNNVLAPMGDADLSPQQRADAIEAALVGNDALAQVLGVGDSDSDAYAALTEDLSALALAGSPVEFDAASGTVEVSGGFGNVIDEISGLDLAPDMVRILKGAALGIAGVGLVDATMDFVDEPSLDAAMAALVDAAGVGVAGGEFVVAMRGLPESGLLNAANKFLYVLGMGSATLDAFDRLGQGDWVGAGLNAAIAGGLFQAAVAGGPIGVSIAAGAQVVLFAYDGWRAALHNNRFENDAQRDFLAASGLSEEAAGILFDTSGEAQSPMPLLMRYCELSGLTIEEAVEYINSLPEDGLRALRQAIHHTTDDMDGGIDDFAASDAQDDADFDEQLDESGLSPDTYSESDPTFDLLSGIPVDRPDTAAQLDALLRRIGVRTPSEWQAAQ